MNIWDRPTSISNPSGDDRNDLIDSQTSEGQQRYENEPLHCEVDLVCANHFFPRRKQALLKQQTS